MRRYWFCLVLLMALPISARADRLGFYFLAGSVRQHDLAIPYGWSTPDPSHQEIAFGPPRSNPLWGLGFTFFRGRRVRGELEIDIQGASWKGVATDGRTWLGQSDMAGLSMAYGINLIPVPSRVVPYVGLGGGVAMRELSLKVPGVDSTRTPGAFSANGFDAHFRAIAGIEVFLGSTYTVGVYAYHHIGGRAPFYVTFAADSVLDATMNLPTAESYIGAERNPTTWTDATFDTDESGIYFRLRYNFKLTKAPGLSE